MNGKLGRKAVKTDTRTLKLSYYLTPALPAPPPERDWTSGVTNWGMMLNDTLGDCTIAACAHAVQVWTAARLPSSEYTVADSVVLSAYEAWDGYDPNNHDTDQGGIELDVLTDWKANGLGDHGLEAFAAVNVKNQDEVKTAIDLFGGVYIGLSLPLSAQDQDVWDTASNTPPDQRAPGSWGGHAVFVPAYDVSSLTCVTWGALKKMSWGFFNAYCDEAYALLGANWVQDAPNAPSGFDAAQLMADLALIK